MNNKSLLKITFKVSMILTLISASNALMAGSVNVCTGSGDATGPTVGPNQTFGCDNNTGIALYEYSTGGMGNSSRALIGIGIDRSGNKPNTLYFGGNNAVMDMTLSLESHKITNLADGTANTDAVNLGQLNTAVEDAIVQSNAYTDQEIATLSDHVVHYDLNLDGSPNKNSVTFAGGANGTALTNVAAGQINSNSKDAVNGAQLNTTNQTMAEYLGGGAEYNTETQSFNAPTYHIGNYDYRNVGDALYALNNEDIRINKRIDDLEKETRSGIAAALAVGSLPQPTLAGKNMVSMAAGTHRGESALAVGLSGITSNEKYIFKMGAATDTRHSFSGTISVGYQW